MRAPSSATRLIIIVVPRGSCVPRPAVRSCLTWAAPVVNNEPPGDTALQQLSDCLFGRRTVRLAHSLTAAATREAEERCHDVAYELRVYNATYVATTMIIYYNVTEYNIILRCILIIIYVWLRLILDGIAAIRPIGIKHIINYYYGYSVSAFPYLAYYLH